MVVQTGRQGARQRLRDLRHVPVLPSLITLGNVFFGFLAMAKVADAALSSSLPPDFAAVKPTFELAALLVFVAMVFDAIDGTVARLTNQATKFGAQLDSLADVVTFGAAPAFIAKVMMEFAARTDPSLLPLKPKLFYGAAVIYLLCAAMRLARFNVETASPDAEDHREFKGLPSPAAAAVVCAMVAFYCAPPDEHTFSRAILPEVVTRNVLPALPVVVTLLGLLMVSRFPFPHLVNSVFRRGHSFPYLASLVVLVVVAAVEWQFALLAITVAYVIGGLVLGVYRLVRRGSMDPPPRSVDDDDPAELVEGRFN
ncbi:MAG: CDP-alcohol phosphatidyltransferase family protein [Planctomycetota bacterium]